MELLKTVMEVMLLEKNFKEQSGKVVRSKKDGCDETEKDYESAKKKEQTMMEMMKNQGKKTKETVTELMNTVMEITTLVEIVKNPVPMKTMMRGIIRRMVVMMKQTVMELDQTVMEMITNGKDSGTDGSGEEDSSDEEETNDESDKESEKDDGCGDGDNGSDDNHDKKSAKEGGYEKKPRPFI
jgi:hypothetical protein